MSAGATVLVVEDSAGTLEVLSAVLRNAGYEVIRAPDGALGIRFAESHQPAVVLLDLHLPDIDGFTVARRVREICQAHVIMLTGDDDEQSVLRGRAAGVETHLTKPITPAALLEAVRAAA